MTLEQPWWLAGLALLLPLILLHLRRPALVVREVPSLIVWDRVASSAPSPNQRMRRPRYPWLLALQAVALCALVVALAQPARTSAASRPTTVYVVDGSLWMRIGARMDDARADVLRFAARRRGSRVAVVAATGTPSIAYRGSAGGLGSAVARLEAGSGAGDLPGAIALGSGLLGGPRGRMIVLRAPEDALPAISAAPGQLLTGVVGAGSDDQGLVDGQARCGIGPSGQCEVVATLRNEASARRIDSYAVLVDGKKARTLRVAVQARSTSTIVLTAPAGALVELRLTSRDALALDDATWVSVPSVANAPTATTVTLVGDPTSALAVAQALAAVPGVTLELRTPGSYRRADGLRSDLVVLDGWLPPGGLPPAPAVALIDPPSVPGGTIGGSITAPTVSGTASGSDLLDGVDLASLSVDRGAASLFSPPSWLGPVVSTPSGPLLAAGDNGRQRLAVLTFDPTRSNLTQLPAFPILARNLVRWASGWTSASQTGTLTIDAVPGATRVTVAPRSGASQVLTLRGKPAGITALAPGALTVSATGKGVTHRRTLAAALPTPAASVSGGTASPIDLASWATAPLPDTRDSLVPWLVLLALAAMAGDWIYWRGVRR